MASIAAINLVRKKHLQLIAFQFAFIGIISCGNVLIWPTEASHWLNIKIIIQELIKRDHGVTILVSNASLFIKPKAESAEKFEIYSVPFTKSHIESLIKGIIGLWLDNKPTTFTFWRFYKELGKQVRKWHDLNRQMCDGVLGNHDFMAQLKRSKYDLLLSDPVTVCGDLLAVKLGIPFVYSLRFSPASTVERHCGKMPSPPSYAPAVLSELTDNLSFGERIKNIVSYYLQDYVFQSYWGEWDLYYSKILDYSHWRNLKVVTEELVDRGHNITVLVHSASLSVNATSTSALHFETLEISFTAGELQALWERFLWFWIFEKSQLSFWQMHSTMRSLSQSSTTLYRQICNGAVRNRKLLEKLRSSHYDILLTDPVIPCGELLAVMLRLPFIFTLRFSPGFAFERLCGQVLAPPSYVPAATSQLQEKMSFLERTQNLLLYFMHDMLQLLVWKEWDSYYSRVLGRPTTLCETMGKAEMWLIRTYWDFEFPRPFLPNFEFVGGLHCQPAKPLPEEMEEFVQSSGEHGIVVFSLGSMVHNLTDEKNNMIATALSQLTQKVLWRYKGKKPETLGTNTRIYDWIPQNDLLGHPKTKAFITHGGTNGIYEAIYHGVPMVGIPMFADQPDNIAHMRAKGMAVELDFNTMKAQDLVDAVNMVVNNFTYKENAIRLSQIHHDQPVKPLDRAVFWIEFVMRHKGAKHLRPAAHQLTWYQYHCLDVLAFLLTCATVTLFIAVKCCLFCCKKCGRIVRKRKME
ncbi:PREDICTED: UDP-glucuronosyltransferase 2A2-like isoform X4 [Gavialis gangeticus]|uniref:UDP-glucuronosyltransferase 2A2-like isoform X4 n=1 Tax=Gavialis gangeticus TaxID=94835 RepID=UPI00092E8CC6|nr:PREDICTED: UDP-glucuronosyltransferase 2A2-like isoform X4 [Gavialis gangeticus]